MGITIPRPPPMGGEVNIVLRMGDFHTVLNLLSTIGKRFQDAGLRELCVESGVIDGWTPI